MFLFYSPYYTEINTNKKYLYLCQCFKIIFLCLPYLCPRAGAFTHHYFRQAVQFVLDALPPPPRRSGGPHSIVFMCDCRNTMPHQTLSAPACRSPIQTQQPILLYLSLAHLTTPWRAPAAVVKLLEIMSERDLLYAVTSACWLPATGSAAVKVPKTGLHLFPFSFFFCLTCLRDCLNSPCSLPLPFHFLCLSSHLGGLYIKHTAHPPYLELLNIFF